MRENSRLTPVAAKSLTDATRDSLVGLDAVSQLPSMSHLLSTLGQATQHSIQNLQAVSATQGQGQQPHRPHMQAYSSAPIQQPH